MSCERRGSAVQVCVRTLYLLLQPPIKSRRVRAGLRTTPRRPLSAMGYALSMFSETLRDRKLVTLEQDLLILIIGFCFPMVSVVIDGLTYGDAVTISPPEYWALFGFGVGA